MKKPRLILTLTASVLALSACVAPFSAFAGDPDPDPNTATIDQNSDPQTGNCQVNYTKPEPQYSYTDIIPASVIITGVPENDKCTISAENVHIQTGYALLVSFTSANYDAISGHLLISDSNARIPYYIKVGGEIMYPDANVLICDKDSTTDMFFELRNNDNAPAGNYSDVLTFHVWCQNMS
jgi:hypothetical protein